MKQPPKKIIHTNSLDLGRLHCDNPLCKHVLPSALPFGPELIGYPCPRCGMNMLTQRDYDSTVRTFRRIDILNRILGPFFGTRAPTPGMKMVSVRIHNDQVIVKKDDRP